MRTLVAGPDPLLRRPCTPVKTIDSYILSLISEMTGFLDEMNQSGLRSYGLAAPQLGEPVQLFVIRTPAVDLVAINPEIVKEYGFHTWIEGCLSLPGQLYQVTRPKLIKFQYQDQAGEMRAGKFHDDYAGIAKHEIDHLHGVMIDAIGRSVSRQAIFSN